VSAPHRDRSLGALRAKQARQAARFFRTEPAEPEPAERTPEEAAAARARMVAAWAPGARSHLYARWSAPAGADGWLRSAARPGWFL
jgi:hypothetical protein